MTAGENLTGLSYLSSKVLEVCCSPRYLGIIDYIYCRARVFVFKDPFNRAPPNWPDTLGSIQLLKCQSQIRDLVGHPRNVVFAQRTLIIETRFIQDRVYSFIGTVLL